jgi:hypothetical protein
MRKERIDLFGDRSVQVIISRPERPALSARDLIPSLAADMAKAKPFKLCFNLACENEIQSLNVCVFLSTNTEAKTISMMACSECSKKLDSDLLTILRRQVPEQFGLRPSRPPVQNAAHFTEHGTEMVVGGFRLGIVNGIEGKPCSQALFFKKLLADRELPLLAFAYRGQSNCFSITHQLYLDLKRLGIEKMFSFKEGNISLSKADGTPVGRHRWIELDGWVIDASGGAAGNPIVFQEAESYYARHVMTDIVHVKEYHGSNAPQADVAER